MTGEVKHLVGEAPLIVIPCNELYEVAVESDTGSGIKDGSVSIGTEVRGNNIVIHILQNTLHRAFGSSLHSSADLIIGSGLLKAEGHINNRHVRSGNTHGHTGELAVEFGDNALNKAIVNEVEITLKYEGYIQRQLKQVEEFTKLEAKTIPIDLDYDSVTGLRLEAREKLKKIRPENFGRASRISGVSPADISVLMIYLEK